jgi:hypothetical protein
MSQKVSNYKIKNKEIKKNTNTKNTKKIQLIHNSP